MPALALATAPPKVTLRSSPAVPYDGAIAAARTCYSPRVIERSEVTDRQRDTIGPLTFEAGHHTVYQHAHFEFGLENISRQFVWSVLHAYPFYNSEQSSQRYVKLKEPRAFVPPISRRGARRLRARDRRGVGRYAELSALLKDDAFGDPEGAALRHADAPRAERLKAVEREAEKKAIETARYVIPIAAFTSMVHTVSGISLHRLRPDGCTPATRPTRRALVIGAMVRAGHGRSIRSSSRRSAARSFDAPMRCPRRRSRARAATATRSRASSIARLERPRVAAASTASRRRRSDRRRGRARRRSA